MLPPLLWVALHTEKLTKNSVGFKGGGRLNNYVDINPDKSETLHFDVLEETIDASLLFNLK